MKDPKVYRIQLVEQDYSTVEYEEVDNFVNELTQEQKDYLKGKL